MSELDKLNKFYDNYIEKFATKEEKTLAAIENKKQEKIFNLIDKIFGIQKKEQE